MKLEKIVIWYSIQNGGDGSAYPGWFLTKKEATYDQDDMNEGWGEPCYGSVETFIGSDIHKEAEENSKEQKELIENGDDDDDSIDNYEE